MSAQTTAPAPTELVAADLLPIRRALISVSDKDGLEARARALAEKGVALVSTGGTAKALKAAGLGVTDVSEVTDFPEILGGRVKTLHPGVHAGLLARRGDAEHERTLETAGIPPIDLVVVNLYPFEATVRAGADDAAIVENIDNGGPAMIRAAAKNHAGVAVCVDMDDLDAVLADMDRNAGQTSLALRRRLAAKAYARTAAYDASVARWFAPALPEGENAEPPLHLALGGSLAQPLHYGENPHQPAALYRTIEERPGVATARQLQGRALGYNNLQDADAAYALNAEIDPKDAPALAIIKHAAPCGVARGTTLAQAYDLAFRTDPVSPFGGVIAANREIDAQTAEKIMGLKTDVVIAPSVSPEAVDAFTKRKTTRVLVAGALPDAAQAGLSARLVAGGLLVQARDNRVVHGEALQVVTKRAPTDAELADLLFAWRVCKHVKSNAIVFAKDRATAGIGGGQTSRVDSVKIAVAKAHEAAHMQSLDHPLTHGSVVASDAFFPFPDGLLAAAEAGATAAIQPGGSVKDPDVIAAADDAGLAMVFTGVRHFRH